MFKRRLDDARYAEKAELVFRAYETSLDLEIATTIVPLTPEERERLLNDKEFEARILVLDAKNREEMVVALRDLGRSAESEGVRLAALRELGRTYYPKRFRDTEAGRQMPRMIKYQIVSPDGDVDADKT